MAGIFDTLLSSLAGQQVQTNNPMSDPNQSAAPLYVQQPQQQQVLQQGPAPTNVTSPDQSTDLSGVDVAAPQSATPLSARPKPYDNSDEVKAIHDVQGKYPDATGPGSFGLNRGTLRNLLGILGDSFLVQGGKQPVYMPALQRAQLGNNAAGMDTDPAGAAARMGASGLPGSMQDAMTLLQQHATDQLRQSQQDNTQAYRDSVIADRTQNHQATQAQAQARTDDRTRSLNAAILAAAAKTGDQSKYAAARQAALARIGPNSEIRPEEYPESLGDFNSGYGLNANQYAHEQTSNASIDERATAAAASNSAKIRGQNMTAGNASAGRAAAAARQQTAIAAKGAGKSTLNIPGLTKPPTTPTSQFQEGKVYKDAKGNSAKYTNGQWVPVN